MLAAGSVGAFLATGLYEVEVPATSPPTADATSLTTSSSRATSYAEDRTRRRRACVSAPRRWNERAVPAGS